MNCKVKFDTELDEILELCELHKLMRDTFPRFVHVLKSNNNSKHWVTECEVEQRANNIASRPETDNRALYILAWGSFEEFIRGYLRDTANVWNKKNQLAEKKTTLWAQHALVCSSVLANQVRGEKVHQVNIDEVVEDLRHGILALAPWNLNAEALSAIGGKMEDDQLELYGKRIGVNLTWSKIGEGKAISSARENDPNGSGSPSTWAKDRFCCVRDNRNIYAHQGVGNGVCDEEALYEAISYLRLLAERLVERVQEDIES
jgi:hypothetical protein